MPPVASPPRQVPLPLPLPPALGVTELYRTSGLPLATFLALVHEARTITHPPDRTSPREPWVRVLEARIRQETVLEDLIGQAQAANTGSD